jgi:hypothetical protein
VRAVAMAMTLSGDQVRRGWGCHGGVKSLQFIDMMVRGLQTLLCIHAPQQHVLIFLLPTYVH